MKNSILLIKNNFKNSYVEKIFLFILLIFFFFLNLIRLDYGLPFFFNTDENSFSYSSLSYLKILTGYYNMSYPIYAPLINLLIILKTIFIHDVILNSLSIKDIISKIYLNPELFIYYGRISSLIVTTISIFFLYLIFKKLRINFFIYSVLLINFSCSLIIYDIATVNGVHAYHLLILIIQLYTYLKYKYEIDSFDYKSYIIFGLLGSMAWGITYWSSVISIYSVILLHLKKFKFSKINYLLVFLFIFVSMGPILNLIFVTEAISELIYPQERMKNFILNNYLKDTLIQIMEGLKITVFLEKNFFLIILLLPIFIKIKGSISKEILTLFFLIFTLPIILFAISEKGFPQLRYFSGNVIVIIIILSIIVNTLKNKGYKSLYILFFIINSYLVFVNLESNIKINNIISKTHTFYLFNKNIQYDKKKILYLIDLSFQETVKQNNLYLDLYKYELIKKSKDHKDKLKRIKDKIKKNEKINKKLFFKENLKKDITYYNYTFHEISNLKLFFDYIKKDFDYVLIEETRPFYLSDPIKQNRIKEYVKKNFEFEKIYTNEKKIFLRSLRSIINYYTDNINRFDFSENIKENNIEIIYGTNYSLYKIN